MAEPDELLVAHAWAAVAGVCTPHPDLEVVGARGSLPSSLPTEDVATACAAVALLAASALKARHVGRPVGVSVDRDHVADAVRSERYFKVGTRPAGAGFAPLSAFWRATDGWVRTHANYPWHRTALLAALRVRDDLDVDASRDALAVAIAELPAGEVEDRVFTHGGIAVRVRSDRDWLASPQGQAVAQEELVGHRVIAGAAPRRREPASSAATQIRVLDLTRVIAGPVCTRFLGALGAPVLRLDPPAHPDARPGAVADTLLAKRTASLDFTTPDGRERLHELLDSADVLVCGYRPGSLDQFELTDHDLATRHPCRRRSKTGQFRR